MEFCEVLLTRGRVVVRAHDWTACAALGDHAYVPERKRGASYKQTGGGEGAAERGEGTSEGVTDGV